MSTGDLEEEYNEQPTFVTYSKEHQFAQYIKVTND